MTKKRESNLELLRLISMFFIVLYHLLLKFIVEIDDSPIYMAMYLPLHVAVICFVLISGYFHITPSLCGGFKLCIPLLLYYLPLTLFQLFQQNIGIKTLLFFSYSPYWFIRTYFYLFLIAPLLNSYIISRERRLYLLLILGFMSVYMGWLMHDFSMIDGKNLVLFMFIYVLGDSLRYYKERIDKVRTVTLIMIYLILNAVLIYTYISFADNIVGKIIFEMSYPYCSPILILNASLLFLIFSRIHFSSRTINWLAGSVFAVYILHHQPLILYKLIQPCVLYVYRECTSPLFLLTILSFMALAILLLGIIVDKLFSPIQNSILHATNNIIIKYRNRTYKERKQQHIYN